MTPEQIAKPNTEAAHQTALFAWAAMVQQHGFYAANHWSVCGELPLVYNKKEAVPELKWLYHIPNGGSRGDTERSRAIEGGRMKAQGVKPGVLDLFLPVPKYVIADQAYWIHGLYIEMKKPDQAKAKNGGLSEAQLEFGNFAISQGYKCVVCYSWQEAANEVEKYLCEGT